MARLPKRVIDDIHAKIDEMFDRCKKRFLGPSAVDKKIYVGFKRDLSLPGVYANAASEGGAIPDLERLDQLIGTAGNYIDALRHKSKAEITHSLQAYLSDSSSPGADSDEIQERLNVELVDLFGRAKVGVRRILDTETQRARSAGTLEGIARVSASVGVEDPTVVFIVVRDDDCCDECWRLHMLEDGKTPRAWKISEIGNGHHKRGDSNPKSNGLHPHCRCTPTPLLPGFGFNAGGFVTWKGEGHDEYARQHGSEKDDRK